MQFKINIRVRFAFFSLAILSMASSCDSKVVFTDTVVGEEGLVGPNDECNAAVQVHHKIDTFDQAARSKIDVLWVMDNSASMAPYQEQLASNFGNFLEEVSSWNADIQMAITSTDMCSEFRPKDLNIVMCPDKPKTTQGLRGKITENTIVKGVNGDALANFSRLVKLGTTGSSFEHGLSAAQRAVELSLAGRNVGFVRADAFLAVVVISDEDDDGVGLSRIDEGGRNWTELGKTNYKFTARNLVSYLSSVKPDGQFSVSSIVNLSQKSLTSNFHIGLGGGEVGSEQLLASKLSHGFTMDIASDNWAAGLSKLAANFSGQMSAFKLSIVPADLKQIEVLVDGVVVDSGWSYVESRQSIIFDSGHLPMYDSHIEVRYTF